MPTFEGVVTFQGNPLTLEGQLVEQGSKAPNFRVNPDVGESIEFDEMRDDKVIILTSALSVDTSVCRDQLVEFDGRMDAIDDPDIELWFISRDLPFALQRKVDEHDIDNAKVFSDYQFHEFGDAFGVSITELGLTARSAIVVDRDGRIIHKQIVPEASNEPDYNAAINAAKTAAHT